MKKVLLVLSLVAFIVACGGDKPNGGTPTPGPEPEPTMVATMVPVTPEVPPIPTAGPGSVCTDGDVIAVGGGPGGNFCATCSGGQWHPGPCPAVPTPPSGTRTCVEGAVTGVGGPNGPVCYRCTNNKNVKIPCPMSLKMLPLKKGDKANLIPPTQ